MRPYLAVIVDSFRAAFASRVLWLALAAIYIFLFALAPIGYREVFTTTFRWPDFANGTRMKAMLARAINEPGAINKPGAIEEAAAAQTPAGRIARSLPDELQRNLQRVAEGQEVRIRLDIFAAGLNTLLESDAWYDPHIWRSAPRLRELRELEALPEDALSEDLRQRRARLRIEAALPGVFESRGARSIALTYAGFSFPALFQVEKTQFQMLLNHFVLRTIIDWVLGFAMIFLGILVTAAIIPDMLQPGSLHLLLSKPVSRPLLFLAKFLGGCAFVLVCVSQLIIGLWLIAGLRLDVWNLRLLLCIPVCVFLFAVFYSVSAVAGLRWRSPILSIGLANLFGAALFVIGAAGALSDALIIESDRITGLTTSGGNVLASTRGGNLQSYDFAANRWTGLFPDDGGSRDRVLAPVTLSDGRVATARVRGGRVNLFGSGATPLLLLDPSSDRPPEPSIELPAGTGELFAIADGALLALSSGDLMAAPAAALRQDTEAASPAESIAEDAEQADDPAAARSEDRAPDAVGTIAAGRPSAAATSPFGSWLPKLIQMMGGPGEGFDSVLPEQVSLFFPTSVAIGAGGEHLFVYSGGRIMRLDRSPQQGRRDAQPHWTLTAQHETLTQSQQVWLRTAGDSVVLFRSGEPPLFLTDSLEPIALQGGALERLAELSLTAAESCHGAGAIALVSDEGELWLLRPGGTSAPQLQRLRGAREVESLHWNEATGQLWVAHHVDRLSVWELARPAARGDAGAGSAGDRPVASYRPALSGWRLLDRYLVTPLRYVMPQTAELGETIATIVSGERALQLSFAAMGEATVQRYNVWRPVLTCGAFIAGMLSLGCVYFARADF